MSFYYYGSKANLARLYPDPEYDIIVEPFGGAAAYSVYNLQKYPGKRAVIVEKSKIVCDAWDFIRDHTEEEILSYPRPVIGERTSDFFHKMSSASNAALNCCSMTVTWRMVEVFDSMLKRMARTKKLMDRITVINGSYEMLGDYEVTWFVDPPYQVTGSSKNGNGYERGCRSDDLDYGELAKFCLSRRGQLIVCEKAGASWLDFQPLTVSRNTANMTYTEVAYIRQR